MLQQFGFNARMRRAPRFALLATLFLVTSPNFSQAGVQDASTQDATANTAQDQPTYDGRTFDQWRRLSLYDLSQTTRTVAYQALAELGRHGRKQEAVEAIVAALRTGHNPQAGVRYLRLWFGDIAQPHLQELAQHENIAVRVHAIHGLARISLPARVVSKTTGTTTFFRRIEPDSAELDAIVSLLTSIAVEDLSPVVRAQACDSLGTVTFAADYKFNDETEKYTPRFPAGEMSDVTKRVMATLVKATEDTNKNVAAIAYRGLWRQGSNAREHLPLLVKRLKEVDLLSNSADIEWEGNVEPVLDSASATDLHYTLLALRDMGPAAKDALPALEEKLRKNSGRISRSLRRSSTPSLQEVIDAIKAENEEQAGQCSTEELIAPPTQQERTFAGRTFEEWKQISLYDLDHETRGKAYKAFKNLRKYRDDDEVLSAIVEAIEAKADVDAGVGELLYFRDAALPYLVAYLESDSERLRLNAAWAFSRLRLVIPSEEDEPQYKSVDLHHEVVDQLIKLALSDESPVVRAEACSTLGHLVRAASLVRNPETGESEFIEHSEDSKDRITQVVDAIAKVTNDSHPGVSEHSYTVLWKQGSTAASHLPLLVERLATLNEMMESPPSRRQLTREEQNAKREESLQGKMRSNANAGARYEQRTALWSLKMMGPAAKDALPVLEPMLRYRKTSVFGGQKAVEGDVLDVINAIKGETSGSGESGSGEDN